LWDIKVSLDIMMVRAYTSVMAKTKRATGYSTEPAPEVVTAATAYERLTRAQLHVARNEAIARQDWLAMRAITYVMTLQFTGTL
jgi:hypothetical protein